MIHVENRDKVITNLKGEIIGPEPLGEEIDCSRDLKFETYEEYRKPYRQKGNGEEILQRDAPLNRYGSGVLYPFAEPGGDTDSVASVEVLISSVADELAVESESDAVTVEEHKKLESLIEKSPGGSEEADLDLSPANRFLPSSMGVSFLGEFSSSSSLVVAATGGRYIKKSVVVEGKTRDWWLRVPVSVTSTFNGVDILSSKGKVPPEQTEKENEGELDLQIEVFSRPRPDGKRLLTVTLINRTEKPGQRDTLCLFQSFFRAEIQSDLDDSHILPYPEVTGEKLDDEEESLGLLYRNVQTFAVGHGCSADWSSGGDSRAHSVSAEVFPICETPSITPDITDQSGVQIKISMLKLAGLDSNADGIEEIEYLATEYERWIFKKRSEAEMLPERFQRAANRHLDNCERCVYRLRDGLSYLSEDPEAMMAFRLANHAVLLQQLRSGREPREISVDKVEGKLIFSEPFEPVDTAVVNEGRGAWRAFQIAFLMMNLRSTADGYADDRETVELIWFPTGGGKTEAYLGLTAFSLFIRRLKNKDDAGVNVLMRYTLRLLTAQQFQRACGLICAMEYLRRTHEDKLGTEAYSIAVWLGGDVTPNSRAQALKSLRELGGSFSEAENVFLLLRCPWCRSQMGRVGKAGAGKRRRDSTLVVGYEQSGNTVVFKCPDNQCDFRNRLPIYVIDEDIYEVRPSLIIGTVDKFASLSWNSRARALFGIDENGERFCSPPGLVIQDELHLISGPLGSIVGLYETVIEELCTDRRRGSAIPPKIVSSTATIRRYEDQIRNLYARDSVMLFPPPGLDPGDSFFARYSRDSEGNLMPGRKYVGINAPGLGSLQNTEVRTYTALMQATVGLPPEQQDPWWTILIFFNNLRMLGNTLTLFQSNVPDYVKAYNNRTRQPIRYMNHIEELTGRLRSDQVPEALAKLEVERKVSESRAVDVCLASNIIEVGVDVDRLSLIVIVGQPKSTSQYIQVTGRVGRRMDRPGLVVSLFSPSKPRDRSHFEKFRSYHEKLYAQVEPTSVTPFSPPALDRALHAVMAAYVRQTGDKSVAESPRPFPEELIKRIYELMADRVDMVDEDERETFDRIFDRREEEWERWNHPYWDVGFGGENSGSALLRTAGEWVSDEDAMISWSTPRSMRSVDSQAHIQITRQYMHKREDS